MISFTVDTGDLSGEFNLTQDDVDALLEQTVKRVTQAFATHWDTVAKNSLGATRDQYRNAIQVGQQGRFTGIVYLNPAAVLPNWIEMGHGAFDMKPGFMKSSKVTKTKNGGYLTIPFQFATSGSLGESSLFAGVMPPEIQVAVKKVPVGESLKLGNIPGQFQIPKSAALRQQMKETGFDRMKQNSQKTSIYEGLSRSKKGSGYVNFRRVSLNSDPSSWIHPGFQAKDFATKALNLLDIPHEVDLAIDSFLVGLGFE